MLVWEQPGAVATAGGMANRAAGGGSSDGIHRAILETGLGSDGEVLEVKLCEAGRCGPDVGNSPSGASLVQSWAAGTQERLPRCRTFAEAVGVSGADLELRAQWRTASVADRDAHKVPTQA